MKKRSPGFDGGTISVMMMAAAVLLMLLTVAVPPAPAGPGPGANAGPVKIIPKVTAGPSGRMIVEYEVRNAGSAPVYHLLVTTFLARDARRSDPYGQIAAGQAWTSYRCDFDLGAMIPGDYIMVSRLSYDDHAGKPHLLYDFHPFMNRTGLPAGEKPPLAVAVHAEPLNVKSLGEATAKYKLSLVNNHKGPVQAVVSFYLPDGITMDETDRFYELGPGGTQADEAVVKLDAGLPPARYPYRAVVWYDFNGVQFSRLLQDEAPVEEKPVLLIVFAVAVLAAIAAAGGWLWWRRRRGSGTVGSGL
ncbi:MAG TPA: hypothetical protein PLU95_04200 [Syntrophales bacterium]|nr:hypothetical protein [Syntrophales bacterium]